MSDNMDIDHNDIKNDPEMAELIEYLEEKKSAATTSARRPPEIITPPVKGFNHNIDHIGHLKQLRHVHMKSIRRIRRYHEETFWSGNHRGFSSKSNKKLGITDRYEKFDY